MTTSFWLPSDLWESQGIDRDAYLNATFGEGKWRPSDHRWGGLSNVYVDETMAAVAVILGGVRSNLVR